MSKAIMMVSDKARELQQDVGELELGAPFFDDGDCECDVAEGGRLEGIDGFVDGGDCKFLDKASKMEREVPE